MTEFLIDTSQFGTPLTKELGHVVNDCRILDISNKEIENVLTPTRWGNWKMDSVEPIIWVVNGFAFDLTRLGNYFARRAPNQYDINTGVCVGGFSRTVFDGSQGESFDGILYLLDYGSRKGFI